MKLYIIGLWMLLLRICSILPSHFLRRILYWPLGFRYPSNSVVYSGLEVRKPQKVQIGKNTVIGHECKLDGRNGIEIGCSVNLSTGVWIWTLQHDPQSTYFGTKGGKVIIRDYVWLSCRVVVLPSITIGEGAVVAAGSVVTKDVAPWTIVGGLPAKKIGIRNKDLTYKLGGGKIPFI